MSKNEHEHWYQCCKEMTPLVLAFVDRDTQEILDTARDLRLAVIQKDGYLALESVNRLKKLLIQPLPIEEAQNCKSDGFSACLIDRLTGLPNRWALEAEGKVKCLAIIDVDNFGTVNQVFGYLLADKVIQEFVKMLLNYIEPLGNKVNVFRFAGDEFVITSREENLRDEIIEQLTLFELGLKKTDFKCKDSYFRLCFSYGLACSNTPVSWRMLFNKATLAMQAQKEYKSKALRE